MEYEKKTSIVLCKRIVSQEFILECLRMIHEDAHDWANMYMDSPLTCEESRSLTAFANINLLSEKRKRILLEKWNCFGC